MACAAMLLCLGGLVMAQKDKDTKKEGKALTKPTHKGKVVSVDAKKNLLVVEVDGKKMELTVGKETKVLGPRGGKADIKDKRLKAGAEVGLVIEKGVLKEVQLPFSKKATAKDKEKDKK
jgi:hypothetical protein